MATLDDVFVIDAVSHAYNLAPANYRVVDLAKPMAESFPSAAGNAIPPAYRRTQESLLRDWTVEETAGLLFRESQTDFSVFHPQSITIFEDGLTSVQKAERFRSQYPTRSAALASVDLIGMDDPCEELSRQVAAFDPHGVKVYPSYWDEDGQSHGFQMDDPEQAFPLWEHASELGLDVVAVHKAVPFVDVSKDPYKVDDVQDAAAHFPELNFEIVHGGMRFGRETGWQLAEYDNVYVNLELTGFEAVVDEDGFVSSMEDLLWAGGKDVLDRIMWGSGTPHYHPRMLLDAFWDVEFPEMEWRNGTYTITQKDKQKILGENVARCHGLDIDRLKRQVAGDQFDEQELITEPYATTAFEVVAQ
jgi:predicted TIM-barrel fold metal-dependent hydrolase